MKKKQTINKNIRSFARRDDADTKIKQIKKRQNIKNSEQSLSSAFAFPQDEATTKPWSLSPIAPTLRRSISAVDHQGRPILRSSSGGWRSASFIIGVEVAEMFAYYGVSSNLISYLTGPLGQSTAENVNLWSGTALLLPLVGAFLADTFLGRYRSIVLASLVYVLGLGLLTLSVTLYPLRNSGCQSTATELSSCSPPKFQVTLFFFSLYLVAIGAGGHKPCVQAFGADQFDDQDEEERKAKSSFFNWWYFGICGGSLATSLVLNYIQDYLSWGLEFGIPSLVMMVALLVFLLGTKTYRCSIIGDEKSPFGRIGRVFAAAARNWQTKSSIIDTEEARVTSPHQSSEQLKFLNKALISPDSELEEAKSVLRLIPMWTTCLVYAILYAQVSTFFRKQGATMDRSITPTITLSSASLHSFTSLSVVLFVPIYDAIFVPTARALTGRPSGITMLQRIGFGLSLSVITMVIAAIVESKRLETAQHNHLLRIWWLVPQYVLCGIADAFAVIGMQEFFYDQVPEKLRSVGLALYLSVFEIGSFLSGFLVSVIEEVSGGDGGESWFSDNLNRAHLDYFYWLLAVFGASGFAVYLYFAKSYIYNMKSVV